MMDIDKMRVGLKLDAQANSHLTEEELIGLTTEERNKLRQSVSTYLERIDSVIQSIQK